MQHRRADCEGELCTIVSGLLGGSFIWCLTGVWQLDVTRQALGMLMLPLPLLLTKCSLMHSVNRECNKTYDCIYFH